MDGGNDRPAFRAKLGDRSLFPALSGCAYFNHAAISPPSTAVRLAATTVLDDYAQRGAGAFPTWLSQRGHLKRTIGSLIGGDATDVALMPNTTQGIIGIALCFPWKLGDRVVVLQGEFPGNVTPWQRAAEAFGLELVWIPVSTFMESEEAGLARLAVELRRGVRLLAVSAVEFQSGFRMPIEAMAGLCHEAGAQIFVDAVQACGVVPIDVRTSGIDYLAAGAHKWLMGLEGAGFLYVSPERVGALRPHVAGWLSHEDPVGFLLRGPGLLSYDRPVRQRADFFESGGSNAVGLAALDAAIELIAQLGVPAIFEHVNTLLDALEAKLRERGFGSLRSPVAHQRSGTLAVRPPAHISLIDLAHDLVARGVSCSTPDGLLRFSPHWPNDIDQVNDVVEAIDESLANMR